MTLSAKNIRNYGFTLIELLMVIGIFMVLSALSIPIYTSWQETAQVDNTEEEIVKALREAKINSQVGLNNEAHGVYLTSAENGDKIISYQGVTYALRDPEFDSEYLLDESISLAFDLSSPDINFSLGLGTPSATGTININYNDEQGSQVISINDLGIIGKN